MSYVNRQNQRSDYYEITGIRSRTVIPHGEADWACKHDTASHMHDPLIPGHKPQLFACPDCKLDQYEPEMYPGMFGPRAFVKDVHHGTYRCDECPPEPDEFGETNGVACYVDEKGDHICPYCGLIGSKEDPEMFADSKFFVTRGGPEPSQYPALANGTLHDSTQWMFSGETGTFHRERDDTTGVTNLRGTRTIY